MPSTELCPCGSAAVYLRCCGQYHEGAPAPTALALMRSRYVAYVRKNIDYIFATSDPVARKNVDRAGTLAWAEACTWTGLTILSTEDGDVGDKEGLVEFVATFEMNGKPQELHELSRFRNLNGRWYYIDAVPKRGSTVRLSEPKPERNAPCACGSGKKYKRCHGVAA
jgi:SEC-C motif domain protein